MSSKRQETHVRLLESARKLLTEEGVSVRLEDIAADAGVSRQSVYLHFGSRNGLLVELADYLDRVADIGEALPLIDQAPDALTALEAIVNHRSLYIPYIYPVARVVLTNRRTDPDSAAAYEDRQKARNREYVLLMERVQAEGLLPECWDIETAAETMRVLLSIPSWEALVVDRGWSRERYRDAMLKALKRTYMNDPSNRT